MRHSNRVLTVATASAALAAILLTLLAPGLMDNLSIWLLIASVFIIGIPHGAIDHIIAAELYGLNQTLKDHLLFYSSYLLVMLVVGALWIFYPVAGMAFFLLISVYHFGQADMEDFIEEKAAGNRILHTNRGLMIIGLIVFSDIDTTYPIMADAMRISREEFSLFMPDSQTAILVVLAVFVLISVIGILKGRIENPKSYLLDSSLLAACLLITGPLVGFAIYFALWHSAGHINEMRAFFESKGKSLSVSGFYVKSLPFTIVSVLGLALLVIINYQLNMENQFLSLMFILISVLTLPHMLIVEKMYDEKR